VVLAVLKYRKTSPAGQHASSPTDSSAGSR
jgi:hypothetical protein